MLVTAENNNRIGDGDAIFASPSAIKLEKSSRRSGYREKVELQNAKYHLQTPLKFKQLLVKVFLLLALLMLLNLLATLNSVNAYSDLTDLDSLTSSQHDHQHSNSHNNNHNNNNNHYNSYNHNLLLPSSSSSDFTSISDDTSSSIVTMRSNLSCYVCMTVDDMRCKFINETNRHILQAMESGDLVTATARMASGSGSGFNAFTVGEQKELQSLMSSYGAIHTGDNGGNNNGGNNGRSVMMTTSSGGSSSETYDSDGTVMSNMGVEYNSGGAGGSMTSSEMAHRIFGAECLPEEHYCAVHRMGVSPVKAEHSQEFNFFALIRSCTKTCNPGCFIIGNGERTKLSFCVSCCTSNYCNYGNSAVGVFSKHLPLAMTTVFISGLITKMLLHHHH